MSEVIIIGYSNPTPEGVVLHTNIPARLKTGHVSGKDIWVSWDKIGAALIEGYTEKTSVDDLRQLREPYQPKTSPTRIKGITEAFSMQPAFLKVGDTFLLENGTPTKIDRINLERVEHFIDSSPSHSDYYVGYNAEGRRLWQYRAETVNVFYF